VSVSKPSEVLRAQRPAVDDSPCFLSRPSANGQRAACPHGAGREFRPSFSHAAGHEDLDMRRARLVLYSLVVALLTLVDVARADPCQTILEEFKTLSDRASREVKLAEANLREAVSDVRGDKRRIELIARSCAAAAEALGVFRSYRIVVSGCMGEQATGRSDALFTLDRTISRLRVSLDKACR
jgi:hypothetical protein